LAVLRPQRSYSLAIPAIDDAQHVSGLTDVLFGRAGSALRQALK
jgi:hypothetical protein